MDLWDHCGIKKCSISTCNLRKSLDTMYQSDVSKLLVNEGLKNQIVEVLNKYRSFLSELEIVSGLKQSKTVKGNKYNELESTLIRDFGIKNNSVLLNIDALYNEEVGTLPWEFYYSIIFDEKILKKIESDKFQQYINTFTEESDKIYKEYPFLKSGELNLTGLQAIQKVLIDKNFFINDNKLVLTSTIMVP